MYQFLDIFFLLGHTFLIFFNLFGWIFRITRKSNLVMLILTGLSWFLLGIFYGIGYCPLTDWHWQILHKLGKTNIPNSYIKYILDRMFSLDLPVDLVDSMTGLFYFMSLGISIYMNIKFPTHKVQNNL